MRFQIALYSVLVLIAALVGCDKPAADGNPNANAKAGGAPAAQSRMIGVTLLTAQHQFYQELRAGLEEEAAKHGYTLRISTAEFDASRQSDQVDQFLAMKVDALVISPCDSKGVGPSIRAANEARVPVVTADIMSTAEIGEVAAHIASDNKAGGRKAAQLMNDALGGTGKVAILSHPEVTSVQDRVAGFKEELAKYPGIALVAELSAEGKRDRATKVMEDLLQGNPDLGGVFAINDDSALGALASIEAAGKAGKVKIVGYDATPEARTKIKSGAIYGDVIQQPREIGRLTILALKDIFEGRAPAKVIPVEVGVFTAKSE